ncbi:thiosulfate/3-mercaptopyruvate sulfurtransferase [Tanacetum coccineum]
MKDFPSCFGENGVQVADASCTSASATTILPTEVKASQNIVTCVYKCKLLGKSRLIIINWSKNLVGHCFSVEIEDLTRKCLSRIDVKPSLFTKRKGSKCVLVDFVTVDVYWDLTNARFGSSPEPVEGYYVGLGFKGEMVLLVGDLKKEVLKKTKYMPTSSRILKREHVYGKKVYATRAQFKDNGQIHDLRIECDTFGLDDPKLVVRLDSKIVMQVKHLVWKFRGNSTISVDGIPVEVYWDVHNWLFGSPAGNAVFMFQACSGADKSGSFAERSIVPWPYSQTSNFCLTLYAWKNE